MDGTGRKKTIRMILIVLEQHKHVTIPMSEIDGAFLLELSEATESYLRKHHQANLLCVVQYLLQDKHFPRSFMFCLQKIRGSVYPYRKGLSFRKVFSASFPFEKLNLCYDEYGFMEFYYRRYYFINGGKIAPMY